MPKLLFYSCLVPHSKTESSAFPVVCDLLPEEIRLLLLHCVWETFYEFFLPIMIA